MNTLEERADDFVPVNYGELLDVIEKVLKSPDNRVFRPAGEGKRYLQIEADALAQRVAEQSGSLKSPLGAASSDARVATTHFGDTYQAFVQKLRRLDDQIARSLEQAAPSLDNVSEYVAGLCTPLRDLTKAGRDVQFGLHYPFATPASGLKKLRLSLRPQVGQKPALRLHRVTVAVDAPDRFVEQLEAALQRHATDLLAQWQDDEMARDELEAVLAQQMQDKGSNFWRLCGLINTETLGKIWREVQVRYLDFLLNNLGEGEAATLLQDYIRRLRLIDTYLAEHAPDDAHYQVSYAQGRPQNYRDLFARGDAFNALPIIPLLDGNLGETTSVNGGERTYHFGVRLKLGGQVHTAGPKAPEVFEYHLEEYLNPEGERHQERLRDGFRSEGFKGRVLRVALLYFFALRNLGDLAFDPIKPFEEHILPALQGDDEITRRKVLRQIGKKLSEETDAEGRILSKRIDLLRRELRRILRQRSDFPAERIPFHLQVQRGVLEPDLDTAINQRSLLRPAIFGDATKEALRYVTVGEARIDSSALCKLTGTIAINTTHFYPTSDEQQFSMQYAVDDLTALPVFIGPKPGKRSVRGAFTTFFGNYRQVLLPYTATYLDDQVAANNHVAAFCYRFTFALIAYLGLRAAVVQAPDRLFLPLLRFHLDNKQQPTEQGGFIRSLGKILSHLFSETIHANTQGFDVDMLTTLASAADGSPIKIPKPFQYKVANGLSSLYGVLPKRFTFAAPAPTLPLDRMAIIIVSSRECDGKWRSSQRKANLMGEIVTVSRQADGVVEVATRQTFSDVYRKEQMHREPTVLIDLVGNLYQEGYRHFVYIARSPYSSTLHMTAFADDADLFFMSPQVMRAFKNDRPDMKLYPVFFDTYPVVRMQVSKPQSLYIQDTLELTQLMQDPSRRTVMFFNLFNGKMVAGREDPDSRFYNGVIAYSTLLNMYNGILDDRDIHVGLLNDTAGPSLKDALLTYLTLFHFARYEGAARDGGIVLKLDPYQHLIGDDSVGRLSMMRHMVGNTEFNLMAFLTEVRKVLGAAVVTPA